MRIIYFATVALLSCMSHASLSASEPQRITFRIGTEELSWRVPKGYCLPSGQSEAVAQLLAASDNTNITNLTLDHCPDGKIDSASYVILKTPKEALLASVHRADLLNSVGAEFDRPEFSAMLESGFNDKEASDQFTALFGSEVAVKSTIKPMGRDGTCAYLGGSVANSSGPIATNTAFVGCITAVRSKVVTVYVYDKFDGVSSITKLLPMARTLAIDLITHNEGPN